MKNHKSLLEGIIGICILVFLVLAFFIGIKSNVSGNEIVMDSLLGMIILHSPFILGAYIFVSALMIYSGFVKKMGWKRLLLIGATGFVILIILGIIFSEGGNEEIFIPTINADDIILGNNNAELTIVEFTDLSCPVCAAASGKNEQYVNLFKDRDPAWEPAVTGVIENYVKTGKVRYVMKYFPGHGLGEDAQLIGWCLYSENKELYLDYHDKVFENQDKVQDLSFLFGVVSDVGGSTISVAQCYDSGKFNYKLNEDLQYGLKEGVKGTPSFFIGNKKVSGAISYSDFAKVIESQL